MDYEGHIIKSQEEGVLWKKMRWDHTLMIHREELEKKGFLTRFLLSVTWLRTVPFRYKGVLQLTDQVLTFAGRDMEERRDFCEDVLLTDIHDVYFSYSNVTEDLSNYDRYRPHWLKPLNIEYATREGMKTMILYANYHVGLFWASDNKEVFKLLRDRIPVSG